MKNANVKGFGKVLSAMALAALLLLTCLLPRASTRAIDNPADDDPYEKLYYFSDYSGCVGIYNNLIKPVLINDYGLTEADAVLNYWSNGAVNNADRFWPRFKAYMTANMSQIRNAFIICEIRDDLTKNPDDGRHEIQTYYLNDIFETLKSQNCKIMFISGTDENRYSGKSEYSDFLDYVDIHICCDLLTDFINSFLYRMEEDYGGYHTILLEQNMAQVIEEYLIPYFRYKNPDLSAMDPDYKTSQSVLAASCVNILIQTGNDAFIDYATGESYNFQQIVQEFDGLCAIGNTLADDSINLIGAFGEAWLYLMLNHRMTQLLTFPIFVYNTEEDLSSYFGTSDLYILDHLLCLSTDLLTEIMEAFIMGGNLSVYDNCIGRCAVTCKPVTIGEDGWVIIGGADLPCWQIYMEKEDWEFYFGEIVY